MNVLIVEDEELAAERLQEMIRQYDPSINIVNTLDTVKEATTFIRTNHRKIDLIFLDIQLADGKSFEIFQQFELYTPVIFTTAYDQFAIEAFRLNSIDYLMKPISVADLTRALDKYMRTRPEENQRTEIPRSVIESLLLRKKFKERFLVRSGQRMYFKNTDEVAYFHADDKLCYMVTREDGRKYLVDYTLEQLEGLLDPSLFYRINRSIIMHLHEIHELRNHPGNRLRIIPNLESRTEMIVSRSKVGNFTAWLDGNFAK